MTPLGAIRALHEPHVSIPVDICTGVPWEPESVQVHEATLEEQAAGMRWWCDECRVDAPCQTYLLAGGAS